MAKCLRCGQFNATEDALHKIKQTKDIHKLWAHLRERAERREPELEITATNLQTIMDNLPSYSTNEKQLLLLRAIEKRTSYPGEEVTMDSEKDFPLAWAKKSAEFGFLTESLKDRGLISRLDAYGVHVTITANGWDYLDKHEIQPDTDQVFVAMWFSDETGEMKNVYEEGIKKAVNETGYKPIRMDELLHVEPINAKMISEIKNSKFVVAEVTGERQNVYFEAGYAMALNKPVIFCAKKHKKIHFDTQMFPHIIWEELEELKDRLCDTICAVIGKKQKTKV
ncbi:MAG: hypothetical protein HQK59_09520 [Deltaproteobacteria bacterium]|nr:hypothetical protein [Deltaproteobacteria bacterium]